MSTRVAHSEPFPEPHEPSRNDGVTILPCWICDQPIGKEAFRRLGVEVSGHFVGELAHARCLTEKALVEKATLTRSSIQTPCL